MGRKYLSKPKKNYLNNLKILLGYHNIDFTNSELCSYTKKELKQLNHKYRIKLFNVRKPSNSWYKTNILS